MRVKIIFSIVIIVLVSLFVGCKQTAYDKAVTYIDNLSAEVKVATNEDEYDKVYQKIVTLNSSEEITNLKDLSDEQARVIKVKVATLTQEALAVKAILYVIPKEINPTDEDIAKLMSECMERRLNVMTFPYGDVRTLVYDYFHYTKWNKDSVE